jgi:hypothetical protein
MSKFALMPVTTGLEVSYNKGKSIFHEAVALTKVREVMQTL